MFKFFFLLGALTFSAAAQQESSEKQSFRFLSDVTITPGILQLQGDSLSFSVKGSIPNESVLTPRNPRLSLRLHSSLNSLDLGEIAMVRRVANLTFEKKFSLFFEPWMEGAALELYFFHGSKENNIPYESRILAKGVSAPQLLINLGNDPEDELLSPQLGLFQLIGDPDSKTEKREEFSLIFNPGSAQLKEGLDNEETLNRLGVFLNKNPGVVKIKITGLQSPEQAEGRNSKLGMNRAEAAGKKLMEILPGIPREKITYDSRWNDWFDFRLLMADYEGISAEEKELVYLVLLGGGSFLEKWEQLKKISGFRRLSTDLFPLLRSVKIDIIASGFGGLTMEQSIWLKRFLSGLDTTDRLGFEGWALAAESVQGLEQKTEIYSRMAELYPSALSYTNLAVLKIRQANFVYSLSSKEWLWEEADRLLESGLAIEPENPYTVHNQGVILALRGLRWEAYKKLSKASVLSEDPVFIESNEVLLGALDILRGDYKLATLRFKSKTLDPVALFYRGLSNYLAGNYAEASLAFEESVIRGRELGYGYYGLALLAAKAGQSETAVIHLQKAISFNKKLAEKMIFEPNFQELRNNQEYLKELKIN